MADLFRRSKPGKGLRRRIRSPADFRGGTALLTRRCRGQFDSYEERAMGLGRGILLWLLGVPLPIVILLALFWHH
jgi:hypothetical protein